MITECSVEDMMKVGLKHRDNNRINQEQVREDLQTIIYFVATLLLLKLLLDNIF